MKRRKNQQRSALLRSVILPEKAWSAHGEGASTTNATKRADTLLMLQLVLTGSELNRIQQSKGRHVKGLPKLTVLERVYSGSRLQTSMDWGHFAYKFPQVWEQSHVVSSVHATR